MSSRVYRDYEEYPRASDLERVLMPHKSIEAEEHYQRLQNRQARLFSTSNHKIELLQSNPDPLKSDVPLLYSFTNADEMQRHLRTYPNTGVRYVFIEADNSRAPLNCTASMLKCILAYEQVPPSFLKVVYAFGDLEREPNDTGLAGFGCDSDADENRLWYLVRSVERAEESETAAGPSWRIRQAAVYQSFNIKTRHSFFLIIQANGLLRKQIHQHAGWLLTITDTGKSQTEGQKFMRAREAGLSTHLVCLSWCCRHWFEFINDLRSSLRPIFDRAATAPVDGELEGLAEDFEPGPQRVAFGSSLRQFRFGDLQRLSTCHGRVAEAMWAAAEAQNVIKSVRTRYEQMANDPDPKPDKPVIVKLCSDLSAFYETLGSARGQLKVLGCKIKMAFQLQQKGLDYRMWLEREIQRRRLQSKQDVPAGRREPALEEPALEEPSRG